MAPGIYALFSADSTALAQLHKIFSAPSIAATNFTCSFMRDVAFRGMHRQLHVLEERVT
jgi:hypothetical protein